MGEVFYEIMGNQFDEHGKFLKQYNKYDLSGEYGIGYLLDGGIFYFDLDDYDKIKDYCWYQDSDGYIRTNIKRQNGTRTAILMHQIIMGTDGVSQFPDHIHGKSSRYDNRKSNLRVATRSQNNINQPIRKDNTSGVKGVSWNKELNKWRVRIQINHKRILIGDYDTLEEAKIARINAEEKYHKEYRYDYSINL